MPSPRIKKLVVLTVAIVLIGSMVLANVPPSAQQGQLRSSGGAPAHVTFKRYLPEGTSEKSARVVEVSPYCVPDWAIAGQWTLSTTQPFKLEGLPFFAKKFGNPGEDTRLAREFAAIVSTDPENPESVVAEAYSADNGERITENFWLSFGEEAMLEPGDYTITLLFGPDYLGGKLDASYNATVSLDKESQSPAWGRFTEGNIKVTRKSQEVSFEKVAFSLKIDQKINDHTVPECREGEWAALTDDEYYAAEETMAEEIEEGVLEEEVSEEEWAGEEEEWYGEEEWFDENEGTSENSYNDRSENLVQSWSDSADDSVWVEEENIASEEKSTKADVKPVKAGAEPAKADVEPVKAGTEPAKADIEPVKSDIEPAKSEKTISSKTDDIKTAD